MEPHVRDSVIAWNVASLEYAKRRGRLRDVQRYTRVLEQLRAGLPQSASQSL